jgi:molybdopterin synthase sulfur carrier subunit
MIRVLFFARIREQLGTGGLEIAAEGIATLDQLQQRLIEDHEPGWGDVLGAQNVLRAVNQQAAELDQVVADGDEVAFFPPVTGG